MDRKFAFSIALISLLYLSLRFIFPNTIEFGYDQPRLATTVLDFLKNGNYLTSQQFSLESPWGNFSWGPVLVFLFSPFLIISKNPMVSSLLVAVFNLISIWAVILIGSKFFSKKVGIIAGLFLATQPWWIIFSRMIYQPSIIPTLISISILFLFKTIKNPRSIWFGLLLFSWGVLIQSYLITFSFILTSVVILTFSIWGKKLSKKYLAIGIILNLIIFLPSIYYYLNNPEIFFRFFEAKGKFHTAFSDVFKNFVQVISGGGLSWQLGYSYQEFLKSLGVFANAFKTMEFLIIALLLYGFLQVMRAKNLYVTSLLLFTLAPLWAIPFIGVESIVPRYFLYILPSFSLFLAYSIEKLSDKFGKLFLIIPLVISIWWITLIFKYFDFVEDYSYPQGYMSNYSDIPYSFLEDSFSWIDTHAKERGYKNYTVSNDLEFSKEVRLDWAQRYYWNNLLPLESSLGEGEMGHYIMRFSPVPKEITSYMQFGPYVVYEVKN